MNSRFRWVGIASLAMLLASACLAADPRPDTTAVRTGSAPGRGGIGGMLGGSYFDYGPNNWDIQGRNTSDFCAGAQPRFAFDGHYRYVFTPRWRAQVSAGLTWSAYSKTEPVPFPDPNFPADATKENYLALLVPVTAQLQLTWGRRPWAYHLGAGPGLYRVWVENRRKVLRDPQTLRLHRGLYPGTTAEIGVEKFLRTLPNTSIEFSLAQHLAFARRDDQFPSGWNGSLGALAVSIGGNYYFDPKVPKKKSELPLPKGAK